MNRTKGSISSRIFCCTPIINC